MKIEIFSSFKNQDFEQVEASLNYSLKSAQKFFKQHPKQKEFVQILSGDKYFIDFKITL